MDMKEKLVELIESARYWGGGTSEEIAEILFSHGVIVLPCKVGDAVYSIEPRFYNYEMHKGIQKGTCVSYEMDERYGWVVKVKFEAGEPHTLYFCNFADFGKTVFLTREEAEAALREEQK